MGRCVIPGVEEIEGRLYFRRRWRDEDGRSHTHRIRLPAIDDPAFAEALARARHTHEEKPRPAAGTIATLVTEFRATLPARKLADSTRRNYALYLDRIAADHGHRTVAGMRPAHCYRIRDSLADTPGVARVYMPVLRLLLAFAYGRDCRADNPASGIPALPIGEHEPWPAEVVEAALAHAAPMLRPCCALQSSSTSPPASESATAFGYSTPGSTAASAS